MTLKSHRILSIASVAAGLLAYRSLALWNPDPFGRVRIGDWLFSSVEALPQIYFALAAALVLRKWKSFRAAMSGESSPALAWPLLCVGSALFAWGHYVAAPDLLLVSFVLVSLGAALLWFGTRFAAVWAGACVIIAFAYPIPAVLTNQLFYSLQLWTADQVVWLLTFVGFPAYHEGNVIFGPGVEAHVIDSCTGLRAIEMLTLATILFVQWSPANRLRGWLLIALAPPIAYAFNLVRVCLIVRDPTSDLSATHTVQGWAAFFGALALVVIVDRGLGRLLPGRAPEERAPARAASARAGDALARASANAGAQSIALAALLVALLLASIGLPRGSAPEILDSPRETLIVGSMIDLPVRVGEWRMGEQLPTDRDFLATVRFSQHDHRPFRLDGQTVDLFVAYSDPRDRDRSPLSPKNALPGRGWVVESRSVARLEAWDRQVERVVARSGTERILSYHWYEGVDSVTREALRALLAIDRSPLGRSQRPRLIRIATRLGAAEAGAGGLGEAEAERRIEAFARALAGILPPGEARPSAARHGLRIARREALPL